MTTSQPIETPLPFIASWPKCVTSHWDRADIEVGCCSAIQTDFSLTGIATFGGAGEVKKWKPHGTL
jgi:hypothetical protein